MSDYSVAQAMHATMTADSLSYLPLTKDELRDQLDVGRIEAPRAKRIVAEFRKAGLLMHPIPTQSFVRVYRLDTELGKFVQELLTANGSEEDERAFERSVRRLDGAAPPEVYRRLREVFEEEGWVRFRRNPE